MVSGGHHAGDVPQAAVSRERTLGEHRQIYLRPRSTPAFGRDSESQQVVDRSGNSASRGCGASERKMAWGAHFFLRSTLRIDDSGQDLDGLRVNDGASGGGKTTHQQTGSLDCI